MSFIPTKRVRSIQQVASANDSDFGMYIYKTAVREIRPVWDRGFLVLRLLPGLNPDTGYETFDPMYLSDTEPGMWIYSTHVVAGAGLDDRRVTFIMRDSFDADDYNMALSPYNVMYKAIKGMESLPVTQRVWGDLLEGGNNRPPALPNAKRPNYFVQCIPYCRDDKVFNFNESLSQLHVCRMTSSAGEAMRKELDMKYMADHSFDATALDQSWFVTIWNNTHKHPYTGAEGNSRFLTYACSVDDTYRARDEYQGSKATLSNYEQQIKSLVKPWDQILRFPSVEQQADWLCYAFDSVPDMVMYAFSDHPEWISERIRNKAGMGAQVHTNVHQAAVAQPQQPQIRMNTTGIPKQSAKPAEPPFKPLMPNAPWDTGADVPEDDLPKCTETENWATHYDNPGDIKY